jgi:hypothetical protein
VHVQDWFSGHVSVRLVECFGRHCWQMSASKYAPAESTKLRQHVMCRVVCIPVLCCAVLCCAVLFLGGAKHSWP